MTNKQSIKNKPDTTLFVDTFPSMSISKDKIIAICGKPRSSPCDLNRLLHLDPILFARTQFVFSWIFPNQKSEYVSIAKIITVLHINTIRNYTMQAAYNTGSGGAAGQGGGDSILRHGVRSEKEFFSRAFARGYAARRIAAECGVETEQLQQYYAAGLLYEFAEYVQGEKTQAEAARRWRFCDMLCDIITHKNKYTQYKGGYKHILFTVIAADYLASKTAKRAGATADKPDTAVMDFLHLPQAALNALKPQVQSELDMQLEFLAEGR
ncbi:MAG: hypothetical protein LBD20_07445 [Spirochaetaceae bacterium]|jgi:HD-like signal output (HDOD) protein|nr:hypothetical protein [Spirochaetaceae bacterium]